MPEKDGKGPRNRSPRPKGRKMGRRTGNCKTSSRNRA